jgi:hypothetical protein
MNLSRSREAESVSNVFWFRPIRVQAAPSAAKRCAMAAPMPRDAPVMMQRRPARVPIAMLEALRRGIRCHNC